MCNVADLLTNGIALVPIPFGQKGPIKKGWNEKNNTITDIADKAFLNGLNIGIAHAYCTPNPTCAIDLDDYKASKLWLANKDIDLDALLLNLDAVVIHSGKYNSLKLLYSLPIGIKPMPSKAVKSPGDTMMIEFRCASAEGLTVQDVLPPSMHPSGTQYQFVGKGSILALPMIPIALFNVWNDLIKTNKPTKKTQTIPRSTPETPREIARVKQMLDHISADCDYVTYRDVVWAILSTGWTFAEQLAEDWCQTAPHRFKEDDFISVVNSYDPNKANPITLGTITYFARKSGFDG